MTHLETSAEDAKGGENERAEPLTAGTSSAKGPAQKA
jgi:hypothetical protein